MKHYSNQLMVLREYALKISRIKILELAASSQPTANLQAIFRRLHEWFRSFIAVTAGNSCPGQLQAKSWSIA